MLRRFALSAVALAACASQAAPPHFAAWHREKAARLPGVGFRLGIEKTGRDDANPFE